jgi:hypothetical protein
MAVIVGTRKTPDDWCGFVSDSNSKNSLFPWPLNDQQTAMQLNQKLQEKGVIAGADELHKQIAQHTPMEQLFIAAWMEKDAARKQFTRNPAPSQRSGFNVEVLPPDKGDNCGLGKLMIVDGSTSQIEGSSWQNQLIQQFGTTDLPPGTIAIQTGAGGDICTRKPEVVQNPVGNDPMLSVRALFQGNRQLQAADWLRFCANLKDFQWKHIKEQDPKFPIAEQYVVFNKDGEPTIRLTKTKLNTYTMDVTLNGEPRTLVMLDPEYCKQAERTDPSLRSGEDYTGNNAYQFAESIRAVTAKPNLPAVSEHGSEFKLSLLGQVIVVPIGNVQ